MALVLASNLRYHLFFSAKPESLLRNTSLLGNEYAFFNFMTDSFGKKISPMMMPCMYTTDKDLLL